MSRIDMHDRKRNCRRAKSLDGQIQHDHRIFAPGKQQHRPSEFGRDLADDMDRLGFELVKVGEFVGHSCWRCYIAAVSIGRSSVKGELVMSPTSDFGCC